MYIQPVSLIIGQTGAEPPTPIEIVLITVTEAEYVSRGLAKITWPKGFMINEYHRKLLTYRVEIETHPKLVKDVRFISGDPNKGGKVIGSFTKDHRFYTFKLPYWRVWGFSGLEFNILVTDTSDKKTLYRITIK